MSCSGGSAKRLSLKAVAAITSADNDVWVSAATVWEMSIKAGLGKLDVPDDLTAQLTRHSFDILPIGPPHALAVRSLPPHHADPFDRMLVAQAQIEPHPRQPGCQRRPIQGSGPASVSWQDRSATTQSTTVAR